MHRRTTLTAALGAAASLALAISTAAPVAAHPPSPGPAPWTTVASGLDNPRLLSWGGDSLYVAESGRGGDGPCVANPEDPEIEACLGLTGAVTRVSWSHRGRASQKRVVTGLPSVASTPGDEASGPADVVVVGKRWWATVGLGGTTAIRDTLGRDGAKLGTLVSGTFGHKRWGRHGWGKSRPRVVADLAAYEAAQDPDGAGEDSNPTGLALVRGGFAVADSGGNDALLVDWRNRVSTVATFPTRLVPPPPFLPPGDIPMDAVPTSAVPGPDGAWYVSQLTGFPFPPGGSTVWRVPAGGGTPTAYATGLTNVTDLAWHKGKLYVVQLVDVGLLNADPEAGLPEGSLRRIERDGSNTVVAEGLPAPYGVALQGRSAYVTTCSICAGAGEVVKVPLR